VGGFTVDFVFAAKLLCQSNGKRAAKNNHSQKRSKPGEVGWPFWPRVIAESHKKLIGPLGPKVVAPPPPLSKAVASHSCKKGVAVTRSLAAFAIAVCNA